VIPACIVAVFNAIAAAANAWVSELAWKKHNEIDDLEYQMDADAADGSAAAILRLERAGIIHQRKCELLGGVRPAYSNPAPPRALPVQGNDGGSH